MTGATTLDEVQTRHLAWCKEFGTMTMSLARKAYARAEAQLDDPEPPIPHAKDETLRFTRLAHTAHQIMRDEARTAAGLAPRSPTIYRSPALADPRHAVVRRTLHRAVRADPDAARLRRGIDQELDREITADPDRTLHPGELLAIVANRIQIPLDPAHLTDELLPDDDEFDDGSADETSTARPDPSRPPKPPH